ncbi:MAG: signal peptide peptidase SppA [Planctomycetota bacterium]
MKRMPQAALRLLLLVLVLSVCAAAHAADAPPTPAGAGAAPDAGAAPADAGAKAKIFHLVLQGEYAEHKLPLPTSPLALLQGHIKQKSFLDLIGFLDRCATDGKYQGIFIDMQDSSIGLTEAELDVLLPRIDKLHDAGIKLFAYVEGGTKLQFMIANHCDVVVMPQLSNLEISAPTMQVQFYKDTLDDIGVKMQPIRVGAYKSAVEPFTRDTMSKEFKENYTALLTDLDAQVLKMVLAGRRNLTEKSFRALRMDQVLTAKQALAAGLVDDLAGIEEMPQIMAKEMKTEIDLVEKPKPPPPELNFMSLFSMQKINPTADWRGDGVAILFLSGDIVDGKGGDSSAQEIAEIPTINVLHQLMNDPHCKAVVLRIDSPGGSASASERINRVLTDLAAKKPLVVSMSNYAASGGYYIAAPAKEIFAQPTTLTGSIGVFGLVPDFGGLLDKIGVKTVTLSVDGTVPMSGMQALTPHQVQVAQRDVDEAYSTFLDRVAAGRHKTPAEIDKIAQGRVYTGGQALAVGLVDHIGTMEDAVAAAAKLADLPADCDRQYFPMYPELTGLAEFLDALQNDATVLPIGDSAFAKAFPLLAEVQNTPAVRQLTHVLHLLDGMSGHGSHLAICAWLPFQPKLN